ncbi:putative RNA12 protein [Aspergillus candidus]|uniref:Mitochondrial escape protein 2 n=1 Tax=Aspergillus candidus TaxID=41067 RepID=A0A2I2FDF3_ASPCN|nr:RNA12 protein-domain-containing protein [Aspergillus candidus]PLB38627.1 RNA12 protein-domain-containing protein [Aspergillus candidus]
MGLDAETNPDNAHIVSPAVADDNTILETYLSPLPGSRRRMMRPTVNGTRPVLFNTVQRRPLGVSCNQSLAGSKCQIIEKLIEPHEHDLVDLFFTHFNPCFPLFDESSFRKIYTNHRHKISPAVLSNLYANALIYWDCSSNLQGTRAPDGRFIWVLACEALHSEMFLAPGTSTVLAIILNVCGRPSTSVFGNGGLMGMAVSLSHALGLNRDPSGWDISPAEKKFRVRIWWCSLAYGTPLQIHRSQYDVPLPSYTPEQSLSSVSQIFTSLVSLTEVLGTSLEHVYSVDTVSSSTTPESLAALLIDWENGLPLELKHTILKNNANIHHPGAANLRLAYLAVTLLHRRIQLNLNTPPSSNEEQYSAAHVAAETIVHFVQCLHETPFPGFWIPMNAYALTSATTFLLRSALHGSAHSALSIRLARQMVCALRELRDRPTCLETGHIALGPTDGLIFISNIFPTKLQWLLTPLGGSAAYASILKRLNRPHIAASDPARIVECAFPASQDVEIKEVVPQFYEGGAFVRFSSLSQTDLGQKSREKTIEEAVHEHLAQQPIRPWFSPFRTATVHTVRGHPWIEDLYRIPSQRLRVDFLPTNGDTPGTVTVETLYSLFRRYGKLRNVDVVQPDPKSAPRYAHVEFSRAQPAVVAKSCLHGFTLPGCNSNGTTLRISYARKIKLAAIRDWVFSHPRIIIPLLAALVAAITVTVFDPIRRFFIEMKIKATLQTEENAIVRWVSRQFDEANRRYNFFFGGRRDGRPDARGLAAIWADREGDISQLRAWLSDTPETFIVVHGPRGSGKREMVLDRALQGRRYKLTIDCKPIQEARGDAAKIARAAAQVGYWPVFSWMNSLSSLVDLAAQGVIGAKAGFSETLDAQLSNVWASTATALRAVALEGRRKTDRDAHLSDDEYLEAHAEARPVVVVDNFLHPGSETGVVDEKIAEWASGLVTGNIAHVIFLTADVSFAKPLGRALPNAVFKTIALGDCSLDVARRFVFNHLADAAAPGEGELEANGLGSCIEELGGRVTDLEFMAHRIEAGESPRAAVNRIITQSATEIQKLFLLNDSTTRPWTPAHAWYLIRTLSQSKTHTLRYTQVLLSDLFSSTNGEATLRALEQAELITITTKNGCPETIRPGRPVYRAVFRQLMANESLRGRMELSILGVLTARETARIAECEEELGVLGALPKQPWEVGGRVKWLLGRVYEAQRRVEGFERESSVLKKLLGV